MEPLPRSHCIWAGALPAAAHWISPMARFRHPPSLLDLVEPEQLPKAAAPSRLPICLSGHLTRLFPQTLRELATTLSRAAHSTLRPTPVALAARLEHLPRLLSPVA